MAFLDRTNISIAGLEIAREYGLSDVRLGWVMSAFLVGYAVFQIPGGLLVRRWGPRKILAFAVVWWAVFTAATASVPVMRDAAIFLILVRAALGVGEATLYPATNQFVERWIPVPERGWANGIIFAGVGIGAGLTPPFVTAILVHYGWRASFWLSAVLGIAAGIVWYVIARDRPEDHPRISPAELHRILSGRDQRGERATPPRGSGHRGWLRVLLSKEILALFLSYFAFGYVAWIFFAWFFIYLAQVRGLDLKTSAIYSMAPFLAMTVGCLAGGAASDWIARRYSRRSGRCWLAAGAMAAAAALLVLGSRATEARSAGLVLAAGAGALYLAQSGFWSVTADVAGEFAGAASGAMNMGAQIGGAVTASLTPLIAAHFGWDASFLVAAILSLLGSLAWLFVDPDRRLASS